MKITKTKGYVSILIGLLFIFSLPKNTQAATCNFYAAMTSGVKSITNWNTICTVAGVDGVDNANNTESSTINSASLILGSGGSITINNGGKILAGKISFSGGNVAIQNGGTFAANAPIYVADADADGWASSFATLYNATASGRRRLSLMLSTTTTDCNDASFSATNSCFVCGNNIVVNHVAGTVSPVTVTITYGTVLTSLTGSSKCWITRNLGATQQATSATDATDASAGWYWAFNRPQGFKNDGTTLTPNSWYSSYDTTLSNWAPANDPCTILLGTGWRLPTSAEWIYADGATSGNWSNHTNTYASVLKIHSAGFLNQFTGVLGYRGTNGGYWSSTTTGASTTRALTISATTSTGSSDSLKSQGFNVRCIKD